MRNMNTVAKISQTVSKNLVETTLVDEVCDHENF